MIDKTQSDILVTCPKGLGGFLLKELAALGYEAAQQGYSGVATRGTMKDAMRLNLMLRTAHRVLVRVARFNATNPDDLYKRAIEIPWEQYISPRGYLSVTSSVDNPTIKDTRFASLKCKDAIVDRIRKRTGKRPDSGPVRGGSAVVALYWKETSCELYMDTSGEPLNRRGYRKIPLDAPLQETLAAAIVMQTGWPGDFNFINPMCGSGTLAIEAALIASNTAPGLLREGFGFQYLIGYDASAWQGMRAEAKGQVRKTIDGKILATDVKPKAIEAARKNAQAAGVQQFIDFSASDYADTPVPANQSGVVVINPEYGERMGNTDELVAVYEGIGDFFKKRCTGYRGFVFTGSPALAKHIGLRASVKTQFFNGPLECKLLEYELYEGKAPQK